MIYNLTNRIASVTKGTGNEIAKLCVEQKQDDDDQNRYADDASAGFHQEQNADHADHDVNRFIINDY